MNPTQQNGKLPSRSLTGSVLCAALFALSQSAYAQTAAPADAGDDEVVKLNPFTVSSDKDYGYRASNSIAGTRTDTPIKDIPINIQVFTRDLADDLNIKNQVDLEAYNASLVYGAADFFSDTPIQQPYQNFLFRGFRQNWGLRDGVREYDPIDMQNLARVEVVKGPAAALYGLAYPGGVMNNITKSVDYKKNFASIRLTAGGEGDHRATIDANVSGKVGGGKFGVRYNGTYERTEDARAHSRGSVKLNALILDWQPTPSTQITFLSEQGFRAKPNGLGWFTTGDSVNPGSNAVIPLQILHPDVSWNWNWANALNKNSLDTNLYRGTITQKFGENFQVQAYVQSSDRLEKAGDGWDANGSGGANSWESASSGWNPVTNKITATYNYRDWGNKMHAYGATAVYKADFQGVKNTFAFGANVWQEDELSRHAAPINPLASAVVFDGKQDVAINVPYGLPADLTWDMTSGTGNHHENNSNDYYFANLQSSFFSDKLKTNLGINKTNMKLIGWNNGVSPSPDTYYEASKVSPLYGAVYEVTKEISLFGVHATSLFPDTTKDSFGNTFSPQVGSSYEFGVKFETADGKLSGTISYFNIKQTGGTQSDPNADNVTTQRYDSLSLAQRALDAQFGTGDGIGVRPRTDFDGDIIQGGEQRSKGFEVDVVYQPIRQWQIVASFANTDHEFTKSAVPATIGQTYPQAIKTRYSLLTNYSFTDGSVKGLKIGFGLSGGSKSLQDYVSFGGKDVARYWPSRITAEIFGSYRFKTFGHDAIVQLNVKNLTKAPQYVGWQATGSNSVLATRPYEVPTPLVYRLTLGLDF